MIKWISASVMQRTNTGILSKTKRGWVGTYINMQGAKIQGKLLRKKNIEQEELSKNVPPIKLHSFFTN